MLAVVMNLLVLLAFDHTGGTGHAAGVHYGSQEIVLILPRQAQQHLGGGKALISSVQTRDNAITQVGHRIMTEAGVGTRRTGNSAAQRFSHTGLSQRLINCRR